MLVHTVKLKPIITSCISVVAIASVHSEKTRLKKMILIIISMKKSQESTVFGGAPEIDFRYETEARKVIVDFKFDALYW